MMLLYNVSRWQAKGCFRFDRDGTKTHRRYNIQLIKFFCFFYAVCTLYMYYRVLYVVCYEMQDWDCTIL